MKKLLVLILSISFFTACSNQADSSQAVLADYPESVQEDMEELPEAFKDSLTVPSELPDSYKPIQFDYIRQPMDDPNGEITNTSFVYAADDTSYPLILFTMYGEVMHQNETVRETITLENGIEAKIIGDYSIRWESEKGQTHDLSLIVPPDGTEPALTIDDLIETANSMEYTK